MSFWYLQEGIVASNYDEISNAYDFTGAVLTSNSSHKVAGTEQLKVLNEYSYDHGGRKINTWQTINTGPRVLLSQLEHDEINQLYKKNLYSTNNGSSFLQTIVYKYNQRRWLTSIDAPLFKMDMESISTRVPVTAVSFKLHTQVLKAGHAPLTIAMMA